MMRQVNNPQFFNIIYNVATLTHCRVYNKKQCYTITINFKLKLINRKWQ